MTEELNIISSSLTSKGKVIKFKPNSILEGIEAFNSPEELNSVVNAMANQLNNELTLIKNKLIPLMGEISTIYKKKVDTMVNDSDITKYKINVVDVPDIIKEMKSNGFLAGKRSPMPLGEKTLGLVVPDGPEFRNYFKAKDSVLNSYVEQILSKYSDEDLAKVWEKYLSNISDNNPNITLLYRDPISNYEDIILFFMVLENIKGEKPPKSSVKDEIYYVVIPAIYNEIKNLLSIINDNMSADRSTGRLVLNISPDGFTINVDKVNYESFLEAGGTPDVIFGLAVSGDYSIENSYLTDIKTKSEEYKNKWLAKIKLDSFSQMAITANRYRALYQIVLKQVYDAYIPQDLNEYLSKDFYTARATLETMLSNMSDNDVLNYNMVSRKIIGDIMFPNTSFNVFVKYMLGYLESSPTFTEKDGATFASFDLILDYLVNQLDIESF